MALRSRSVVLDDLAALTDTLANQRLELADLLAAELQCKVQTFWQSSESTVKGREPDGDFNSLNLSVDIVKLRGEILANEDRRALYLEQLHYARSD